MFCTKCGRPVEDGQKICPECAAAEAQPVQQEEQPVVQAEPVQQSAPQPIDPTPAPAFVVNTDTTLPAKKKKKKGKTLAIVLGIVAVLLAAAVTLTLVFWPQISSFFKRNTMSAEDYLMDVEKNSVSADPVVDAINGVYDMFLSLVNKPAEPVKYDLTIEANKELLTMLESSSGGEVQLTWLEKLNLSVTSGVKGTDVGAQISLGANGVNILMLDAFMNVLDDEAFVGLPELNETYISVPVDLADAAEALEMSQKLEESNIAEMLPSSEDFAQMVEKYKLMALEELTDVEKSTETVTIDKLSQKCTVLTVEVSDEAFQDIVLKIVDDAREDETAQALLKALCEYVKLTAGEEITPEELLDEVEEGIKEAELTDEEILIKTYVDMTDQIIGRFLEDANGDEFGYVGITNKDGKWEQMYVLGEEAVLLGDGTKKNDVLEGTYTLKVEGESVLHCKLKDVDLKALEEGQFLGTIGLVPSDMIIKDFLSNYTDSPLTQLAGLTQPTLEITVAKEKTVIGFKVAGTSYLTVTAAVTENVEYTPAAPEKSASMEDATDALAWAKETDFDKLLKALEDAKVPQDYIDYLSDLFDQLV